MTAKKFQLKAFSNYIPRHANGAIDIEETDRLVKVALSSTSQLYYGSIKNIVMLEMTIIGSCLIEKSAFKLVETVFYKVENPFYEPANNATYTAMRELARKGRPIDMLTVYEQLCITKKDEKAGGAYYLGQCTGAVTSTANIEYHTRILYQHYLRRKMLEVTSLAIADLFEKSTDIFDIAEGVVKEIQKISNPYAPGITQNMGDVMQKAVIAEEKVKIFGDFIRKNDFSIMFSGSGMGKSLLATQIADDLSNGRDCFGGLLANDAGKQKVLIFDFEMKLANYKARYCDENGNPYQFNDEYFYRYGDNEEMITFDFTDIARNAEKILSDNIEKVKPDFVIIDNLSCLNEGNAADAEVAMSIINLILRYIQKSNITVLALAHTPKILDNSAASLNQLAGSSVFSRFAHSIIQLGKSATNESIKYAIQLKSRGGEMVYTSNFVLTYTIEKRGKFTGCYACEQPFQSEKELLFIPVNQTDSDDQLERILQLKEDGLSLRDIAEQVLGHRNKYTTINNWLKGHEQLQVKKQEMQQQINKAGNLVTDEEAEKLGMPF